MTDPSPAPATPVLRLETASGRSGPVALTGADHALRLESGGAELYAQAQRDGAPAGPRRFLGTVAGPALLPALPRPEDDRFTVLCLPLPDARIVTVPDDAARSAVEAVVPSVALDSWLIALGQAMVSLAPDGLRGYRKVEAGERATLSAGQAVFAPQGAVWARVDDGRISYCDAVQFEASDKPRLVPLAGGAWLRAIDPATLETCGTDEVARSDGWTAALRGFHDLFMGALATALFAAPDRAEPAGDARRREAEALAARTLERFTGVFDRAPRTLGAMPDRRRALLRAVEALCAALGATFKAPAARLVSGERSMLAAVEEIAAACGLRVRQLTLEDGWWARDPGPLLGFAVDDERPLAIVPDGRGYAIIDPVEGARTRLSERAAETFARSAYAFFAPLPDRPLSLRDLLSFGARHVRGDLAVTLLAGALGGAVSLAVPFGTGFLFETAIPGRYDGLVFQICAALGVAAFAAVVFGLTGEVARLRIDAKLAAPLMGAVWDRILRRPASFFARYPSGDLAARAISIDALRRAVARILVGSVVALGFLLFSGAVLVWYAPRAAAVAGALALLLWAVAALAGYRQMKAFREGERLSGNIFALVLDLLSGVTRLRLSGAEERAFAQWGQLFAEMRARQVRARRVANQFSAFAAGYEVLALASAFAAIGLLGGQGLSTGAFLAFLAAFNQFLLAARQLAQAIVQSFTTQPLVGRARPLLETQPERDSHNQDPGALRGGVEVHQLSFRYQAGAPWVFNGLSFSVAPGELVAIVGPSGAGKSTLVRLLLGFERPTAGAVFYDGHDLRHLDLGAVRRQIGVVLQNDRLMAGSLYENIVGATGASVEDAWEAARLAGLADDIAALPMGMHTVLSEGAVTLSGGQFQRLLIARALVGDPRLLILDEATSALDNQTQAVVAANLDRLAVTRIVIAHRLSTVINADAIHVLDGGRIVESGRYAELVARNGPFAELVERQLLRGGEPAAPGA